ncbi:MAG TPA: HNH endonuclease signature motif containing protein [Ktedonobacteraceae bacterium]|nr:HNH endonuclease signature motif containing protein [Ktedonobacteraceae bacterium]
MRIQLQSDGIYLELSRKTGNGFYSVPDPLLVEATIDTLVRMAKRQLVGLNADANSRHIPQDVRNAVWQRDQGRCVQCGVGGPGAYLEFDHIIPYSKGGASTTGNVQLLCRNCNLKKGDRI